MQISRHQDRSAPYNTALQAFQDKNVLITGAGRGIGKRLAIGFAAHGAKLGLLARSKSELDLAQLEIEHAGGVALRLRADVRDSEQIMTAADRMIVHYGSIDIVICAAGIQGPIGPMMETSGKAWIETIETNLFGVVNVCRAVMPAMIARRAGKILVLSGGGAAAARPNFTAYSASKAALVRMVESLAEEVRDHNVQVNCMGPGGAYTSMTDEILNAGEKAGWREIDAARQVRITGGVTAEKQIDLALFLTSERANHISGKLVDVRDDWKRLERENVHAELYTLRRVQKV